MKESYKNKIMSKLIFRDRLKNRMRDHDRISKQTERLKRPVCVLLIFLIIIVDFF